MERLAEARLIDGVVQSNMTVWEETDDVLSQDGLIDLEKYEKKAETEFIIRRAHGNELPRILKGLETYRRIAAKTGVRLYSEIQWENTVQPEAYAQAARQIYENGGEAIALWDAYPMRVTRLPEWYCTARLGSMAHIRKLEEDPDHYRKIYKVLSYDGEDMRLYNPNWRG